MQWRVQREQGAETGGVWAIWCPELPGCTPADETEKEALKNAKEAIIRHLRPDPIDLFPAALAREFFV